MIDIQLNNISKSFGEKVIFKDFSLEIKSGENICIFGESGKGKTTLLNIIGMLEYPDSGEVYIKGVKNPFFNRSDGRRLLRNEISYVFQNGGLIDDQTVKYNLEVSAYYTKKTSESDYFEVLEKVGLESSVLKKKIFQLSGGEQQRVALARIYLKPSSIILADEPTGSLDEQNRNQVIKILRKFNEEGKTVVIVSHDKEVIKCSDRNLQL